MVQSLTVSEGFHSEGSIKELVHEELQHFTTMASDHDAPVSSRHIPVKASTVTSSFTKTITGGRLEIVEAGRK